MQYLPKPIIEIIFNYSCWKTLRLVCKQFYEISKTDTVMRRIVNDPGHVYFGEYNIYENLIKNSKKEYLIYCVEKNPPIERFRSEYGIFDIISERYMKNEEQLIPTFTFSNQPALSQIREFIVQYREHLPRYQYSHCKRIVMLLIIITFFFVTFGAIIVLANVFGKKPN